MEKGRIYKKSRRAKTIESTSPFVRLLLCGSKAAAIAFLAALAFVFIGGAVGMSLRDPASIAEPIGLAAFFVSFVVCGFVSSKLERGNPIVTGLFSAAVYLVPILIISLIIKASAGGNGTRSVLSLLALPCAILGAFLGNVRIAKRKTAAQMRRRR